MLAAVRIRGVSDTRKKASETLQQLRLHNKHNCVLIPDDDTHGGMLNQVKDYVAYGTVSDETVETLLARRGTVNGMDLPDAADELGYDSVEAVAAALVDGETTPWKLASKGMQLPFRLSPPSKGFDGTRQQAGQGGSLGKRDDMDALLERMI